jgi:hypothetical protein
MTTLLKPSTNFPTRSTTKSTPILSRSGLDSKPLLDKLPGGVGGKLGGVLGD